MHKQIEDEFAGNQDVVFMYIQTVFEGSSSNTFINGIVDLDEFQVKGIYGFDPRDAAGTLPVTMQKFSTQGTPYTVILDKTGQKVQSEFTQSPQRLRIAIENALAAE